MVYLGDCIESPIYRGGGLHSRCNGTPGSRMCNRQRVYCGNVQRDVGARLNRSCWLRAPPSGGRGAPQVRLPNVVFGLQIVLGLNKWAKSPFGRSRTIAPQVVALDEE